MPSFFCRFCISAGIAFSFKKAANSFSLPSSVAIASSLIDKVTLLNMFVLNVSGSLACINSSNFLSFLF